MRTLASLMDFSQSALFFDLSFQFVILNLLISVGTQFLGRPLSRLTWGLLLNTWLTFHLLSILDFITHTIFAERTDHEASLCTFLQSRHVWGNSYSNRKSSNRHSIVCIVTWLRAERVGVWIPATTRDFSLLQKSSEPIWDLGWEWVELHLYRGADKSLARPGKKQATATEDFDVRISYLLS
jgi:hypothetical protein